MLKKTTIPLLTATFLVALGASCSKTEQPQTEFIKDYFPLEVGQYTTYRMDSTVYVNLNTEKEVHSYLLQEIVDARIKDNLGRDAYVIRRKVRSETDTTVWNDASNYLVVPSDHTLEVVNDNLRFVKMREPIMNDQAWRGNLYINTFSNSDLQFLKGWEYRFTDVKTPFTLDNGLAFSETATVRESADTSGVPGDKTILWEIIYSQDVYAKGKGLVYRQYMHETWQPPSIFCVNGCYQANSYGITLRYLNSNR